MFIHPFRKNMGLLLRLDPSNGAIGWSTKGRINKLKIIIINLGEIKKGYTNNTYISGCLSGLEGIYKNLLLHYKTGNSTYLKNSQEYWYNLIDYLKLKHTELNIKSLNNVLEKIKHLIKHKTSRFQ